MLLLKFLHIALVSFWLAGALYLPWVFEVYARASVAQREAHAVPLMRRLYFGLMTPAAIGAVLAGIALTFYGFEGGWLPLKLSLVLLLVLFHIYCGRQLLLVEKERPLHGPLFFAILTAFPAVAAMAIVALAVAKPF